MGDHGSSTCSARGPGPRCPEPLGKTEAHVTGLVTDPISQCDEQARKQTSLYPFFRRSPLPLRAGRAALGGEAWPSGSSVTASVSPRHAPAVRQAHSQGPRLPSAGRLQGPLHAPAGLTHAGGRGRRPLVLQDRLETHAFLVGGRVSTARTTLSAGQCWWWPRTTQRLLPLPRLRRPTPNPHPCVQCKSQEGRLRPTLHLGGGASGRSRGPTSGPAETLDLSAAGLGVTLSHTRLQRVRALDSPASSHWL